ncbi:MAG: DNA-processing protein DprA [Dissulfurimicrobium sp.]|uniref:DNA-processing protein DprA n=1 Tax=Dissulfurimicrobium hydrothermale TaxID=1750598 RepID=UPI003C744D9F
MPGIGSITLRRLVDHFGSPEAVLKAQTSELDATGWLSIRLKNAILAGPDWRLHKRCMETIEGLGVWTITYRDKEYPKPLGQIPDPPAILYGLGDRNVLNGKAVAVIGSRKASAYGIKAASEIASGLAEKGITVVSGLAPGIDFAAHEATLKSGGVTIAVKGCGIDVPYPRHDKAFIKRITSSGAIITEFPPGTAPEPKNFPIRNRIISGLCLAVVVIEAGLKSGSLITASCALEQGREVMAVPGSIYSNGSTGSHWLIKQGARLVENATDILDGFCIFQTGHAEPDVPNRPNIMSLGPEERLLYNMLDAYPVHIDEIVHSSGLPVAQVNGILLQMELKDLIQVLPGQMYQKK